MATNEEQIRTLIERWAKAVHHGDLTGVLADHTQDIVMFDVPPPQQGVRGLDAYRETWPPFFRWQAQGASFDVEALEVTAGEDVAFAYALLRCGTERDFADNPDSRLRLTFGLRKQAGRWVIVHEHHSVPLTDGSTAADPAPHQDHAAAEQDHAAAEQDHAAAEQDHAAAEQDLRQLHQRWFASTAAKDLDGLMAPIADEVVSYEHDQVLQCVGVDAIREVCKAGLDAAGDSSVTWHVPDLKVLVDGDLAVAWGLNHVKVTAGSQPVESWSRGTRVFQRRDGAWLMTHQHLSYPFDPVTGDAKTDLRP